MKLSGVTYFENSRRATLAQRAYCIANPGGFTGYGENIWGLTAGDGPDGYTARGAPPAQNDDGTISPTAPGGSIVFTPTESLAALRYMYDTYKSQIWKEYGFRDAFNLGENWWASDVIGIDQGPIIIMMENYRNESVWNSFMQNEYIQTGLERAGFTAVTSIKEEENINPQEFSLDQNFPNPFNNSTIIKFRLPFRSNVKLSIYDVIGQEQTVLVNRELTAGEHKIAFKNENLPSGIYFYKITYSGNSEIKRMLLIK